MEEERQEVQNNKSAKVLSRVNSDSIETPPEETMILRQALLSSNLQPSAQIKVNELLYQWLSLPQTRYLVNDLAQECILRKETDFHNGSNLQNEDIGQGTANGCCSNLSATYNNMELEVKESEQQPKYHKLDEKLLLENQTLRKAAVAAASLDSHPPLSPCTSSDSPRQEKSPITPSRRSKTLLSTNGSKPSSNPSTTVKSHDTPTNQIETKESSRDSHISNYSIPQFYFPGDPRAQHRHAIEARMRCRARRKSKQEHEPTKGIETVLSSKESKVGNSGDNDRKILHYENLLKTEELSGSDIDENFFVKYLPEIRKDLLQIFDTGKGTSIGISLDDFAQVTKEFCGFPSFFAEPLALRVRELWNEKLKREDKSFIPRQKEEEIRITMDQFEHFWHTEMEPYDRYTRFFRLVKQRKNEHIFPEDFEKFLNELLTFHPGLEFLHETEEFQDKYKRTVIARIMYVADIHRRGYITVKNLRKATPCVISAFDLVDEEEDINIVHDYFSYEHFYVLYCRFWELDTDHDFLLCKDDLLPYGCHALTCGIVDRYFEQPLFPFIGESYKKSRETKNNESKSLMGYEDFVYFMLNEEDKSTEVSLRTWFACVDLDGDGTIRPHEMRQFYAEQLHRMECLGQEVVPFEDVLCQMTDHIEPKEEGIVRIGDLLRPEKQPSAGIFFNVLFNLNKFIAFEQRDPFQMKQMQGGNKISCWARFAGMEYARLAMEEEYKVQDITTLGNVHVDLNAVAQ